MSPKPYRLLDSERTFLEEGVAPGGYRAHEMEDRLREKVELLAPRFERLFEDVELLEQGSEGTTNLFDTDAGRHVWMELMGLDSLARDEVERALSFHRGEPGSGPAAFGAKLGRTVNRLTRWPAVDYLDHDDIVADLVWGFLRGLHYDPRRPGGNVTADVVREETTEILRRVENRAETHADAKSGSAEEFRDRLEQRMATEREMAMRVYDILGEDHPTTSVKVGHRDADHDGEGSGEDAPCRFCVDVVDHLIDDAVDGAHKPRSPGQNQAFWSEYGPAAEFAVADFVTEAKVHAVIEANRLFEKHNLRRQLERDAEALADKGSLGASAEEVLSYIVEEGFASSTDIAQEVYDSRDYAASVTRLAKDLAGLDCEARADEIEVWTEYPLLEGDQDGWTATRYGEAADHALQRYQALRALCGPRRDLMRFPVDLLDGALAEVATAGEE